MIKSKIKSRPRSTKFIKLIKESIIGVATLWSVCANSVPRSVHVIQCKSRHFHVLLIIWLHVHVENNTSTGIYFGDKSTMYMYISPLTNWCIRVVRMHCQVHVHLYLVLNIYVHLFSYLLKCICCNCSHADIYNLTCKNFNSIIKTA